ncbi:hypothetical protein J3A78_000222 [Streptomyces sp. PvR006]|nr:hypothetical protein [Streptomyces sp. PvR006]
MHGPGADGPGAGTSASIGPGVCLGLGRSCHRLRSPMRSMRPHVHPAAPAGPNRERSAVKDALRAPRSPAGLDDRVSGRRMRA